MAEDQSKHRHEQEKKIIEANIESEKRGINYSFILTLLLFVIGATLVLSNKDTQGFALILATGGFHILNYFYQRYLEREQRPATEENHPSKSNRQD